MDTITRFEIEAKVFYKMTGFLAPGKDEAAAVNSTETHEQRLVAWETWNKVIGHTINLFLDTVEDFWPDPIGSNEEESE